MVDYKIIPELSLIIECYSGNVNSNEVIGLKRKQIKDKDYNCNLNTIAYLSDIVINQYSRPATKQFVNLLASNVNYAGNRKSAIITKSPVQVVVSTLYQLESKKHPMCYKTVSTIAAAMNWLLLPQECEPIISKNLESLKKQAKNKVQTILETTISSHSSGLT
ncbi:MAG: hypothetical protein N4A71_09135 [Carboxylicivirga sp.]|jgi:hypothetical protein|nr:hypothetical protein [Carboxylicivirga sp.]